MIRFQAFLIVALALFAVGCGKARTQKTTGSSPKTTLAQDKRAVKKVMERLSAAVDVGNGSKACKYIEKKYRNGHDFKVGAQYLGVVKRAKGEKTWCESMVNKADAVPGGLRLSTSIDSIVVTGNKAVITGLTVSGDRALRYTDKLRKIDGKWLIYEIKFKEQ